MKTTSFLPRGKHSISEKDIQEVVAVLKSESITRGPKVEEFENAAASYCGAKYAVAFSSGTSALMAAYHAAELNPYDRLITTPNTFAATVGAGIRYGATPVFVDIERNTGNLELSQIEHNINYESTRGRTILVPVHFSGIPVDMCRLEQMIAEPYTVTIEDAAHALGSSYPSGEKVGSCTYSAMTTFSFHPAEQITTGEGGMVTTNDDELCHRLKKFRNNGIETAAPYLEGEPSPGYYEVQEITGNFNFTEIQAALGLSQLKRLDKIAAKRRALVAAYRERLKDTPHLRLFTSQYDDITAYQLFVVQIDFNAYDTTRAEVMRKLTEEGIGTQVHYIPVYRHPFFTKGSGDIREYFPNMEAYYSQALSLPLFYDLTTDDVDRIVKKLKKVLTTS